MAARDERAEDASVGEPFGRYTLHGKLAAGGMAAVFLGRERLPGGGARWVAIKRVHPHLVAREDVVRMFLNEAKLLSRLDHENICRIVDFGIEGDAPYIVMSYLHGAPLSGVLRRLIERGEPLPVELMVFVAACVCDGLHYAHDATGEDGAPLGLVHRDISPQNIFLELDGKISLLDFGVAKAAGFTGFTRTGHIKGKYAYMSPEQVAAGELDRRSDIFSLGIVLWESLTGRHLFRRKRHIDTLRAIAAADVPPLGSINPAVPVALDQIVLKALQADRRRRYPSAKVMGAELRAFLAKAPGRLGAAETARILERLFPDRRHPSEAGGPVTQPEAIAIATLLDAGGGLAEEKGAAAPAGPAEEVEDVEVEGTERDEGASPWELADSQAWAQLDSSAEPQEPTRLELSPRRAQDRTDVLVAESPSPRASARDPAEVDGSPDVTDAHHPSARSTSALARVVEEVRASAPVPDPDLSGSSVLVAHTISEADARVTGGAEPGEQEDATIQLTALRARAAADPAATIPDRPLDEVLLWARPTSIDVREVQDQFDPGSTLPGSRTDPEAPLPTLLEEVPPGRGAARASIVEELPSWARAGDEFSSRACAGGEVRPGAPAGRAGAGGGAAEATLARVVRMAKVRLGLGERAPTPVLWVIAGIGALAAAIWAYALVTHLVRPTHRVTATLPQGPRAIVRAPGPAEPERAGTATVTSVRARATELELPDQRAGVSSPRAVSPARRARARELEGLGGKAMAAGEPEKAERLYVQCVELAALPPCHRALGGLYAERGEAARSVAHYRRYLELAPDARDAEDIERLIAGTN